MSLINDALRKARQAAADHEEQRERSLPPRAYPQRSGRSGVSMAAVALVAVAAGIGGAVVVWWAMSRPAPVPAAAVASAPVPARTNATVSDGNSSPGAQPLGPPAEAAAASEPSETGPPTVEGVGASTAVVQATPTPPGKRVAEADEPVEPVAAVEDPRPTPAAGQTGRGPAGERVYVLDADLGATVLSLGYIVFRPVRPFAEINGVEVYEGSEVEGFTVEKIEADKVTLRDAAGPLVLRVP